MIHHTLFKNEKQFKIKKFYPIPSILTNEINFIKLCIKKITFFHYNRNHGSQLSTTTSLIYLLLSLHFSTKFFWLLVR